MTNTHAFCNFLLIFEKKQKLVENIAFQSQGTHKRLKQKCLNINGASEKQKFIIILKNEILFFKSISKQPLSYYSSAHLLKDYFMANVAGCTLNPYATTTGNRAFKENNFLKDVKNKGEEVVFPAHLQFKFLAKQ